jgi:large subunit ribosomal protein L5
MTDKNNNVMKNIKVEKLTFNFGSGKDQKKLEKGMILIKHITGKNPIKTITQKRIPSWGLRPGLPVGCKLTLRGKKVQDLIVRLLKAKKNQLTIKQFDNNGSVAFGIHEYIEIPEVEYEPKIGIMGFEVCITLSRPGFRIKNRKLNKAKIHKNHKISKEEAIEFMKKEFSVEVGEKK